MHGKIFVIASKKSLKGNNYLCPLEDYKMVAKIPGCDRVYLDDIQDFHKSIEWFNDFFYTDISMETVNASGRDVPVGVMIPADINGLIRMIEADKEDRLMAVEREVQKNNPSMWHISQLAYMDSAFYFVFTDDSSFINEMELLERNMNPEKGPLYITQTYDYHM